MKNSLSKIIIIVALFISLSLSAHAIKLEENNTYSGTIKDSNRNNIPLPPGEWLLTEINIIKPTGRSLGSFVEYTFYSSDVGYVFYFGPKGTKGSADMWTGLKTPSMCDESPIAGKTKIRGINNTEWCVFDDGEYIEFRNYTAQNYSQYYHSYYIDRTLLRDKSKTTLQSIGARIFDQVRKNKAGDISFLSNRLDFNKSSSISSDGSNTETDRTYNLENAEVGINDFEIICSILTCEDSEGNFSSYLKSFLKERNKYEFPYLAVETNRIGSGRGPAWQMDTGISYSISGCEERIGGSCSLIISNGKIVSKKFYNLFIGKKSNGETKENLFTSNSSTKDKLKELKTMLKEGLITQDQYDKKSDEILETF